MVIGVLALQGDFEAHARVLEMLGAKPRVVRTPEDLNGLDGLVMPGGESTTMSLGIEREHLAEPLQELIRSGTPTLGTCAGLIMLDRNHLNLLDVTTKRNAFGRQIASFEADLDVSALGDTPFRAVFIRAPWVEETGPDVETLATIDGHPVAVRRQHILGVAFHPELTDDGRVHRWLVERIREQRQIEEAA
jgi:pyridoxal 5'-phosphate synthase pdxT subunit